jgi:hypothetical protein
MKCRHCGTQWEDGGEYCPQCHRNYGGAKYPATQTDEELRDIARLIQQIHKAFTGVVLGRGDTIHQAHLEGVFGRGEKWIAEGEKDPESDWSEVPDWKLEQGEPPLIFFDVEGWRFYLPAFMCLSLRNWRTTNSWTSDPVISTLTDHEYWAERFASLNRVQSEAVYDFLEFFDRYSGEPQASKAIQAYWHQFRKD